MILVKSKMVLILIALMQEFEPCPIKIRTIFDSTFCVLSKKGGILIAVIPRSDSSAHSF